MLRVVTLTFAAWHGVAAADESAAFSKGSSAPIHIGDAYRMRDDAAVLTSPWSFQLGYQLSDSTLLLLSGDHSMLSWDGESASSTRLTTGLRIHPFSSALDREGVWEWGNVYFEGSLGIQSSNVGNLRGWSPVVTAAIGWMPVRTSTFDFGLEGRVARTNPTSANSRTNVTVMFLLRFKF